jgi:hypothetical protein
MDVNNPNQVLVYADNVNLWEEFKYHMDETCLMLNIQRTSYANFAEDLKLFSLEQVLSHCVSVLCVWFPQWLFDIFNFTDISCSACIFKNLSNIILDLILFSFL